MSITYWGDVEIMSGARMYDRAHDAAVMRRDLLVTRTARLVAAFVARNSVPAADVPAVIKRVHAAFLVLLNGMEPNPRSALPTSSEITASIRYDRLVSFIDGKAYKSLKRHLTAHGMTPSQYRALYGLPQHYPMISPGYAQIRSRIAKQSYRGKKFS